MNEPRVHAVLDLLDRQVVDRDGEPIGKVDDLRLGWAPSGRLVVTALLLGPQAYGSRIGGPLGRAAAGLAGRLSASPGPVELPVELIEEVGPSIKLGVLADDLPRTRATDRWLREHFVSRIPGSGHASE